jgi:peptidoglycan/LPS O-acetylase OafA/YrhL
VIGAEKQKRLHFAKPWVWLGDWSYGIYLSHILVILTVARVLKTGIVPFAWGAPGVIDDIIFVTFCLAGTIITAAIAHYTIEKPVMRWLR